jgi:hypothetical protein
LVSAAPPSRSLPPSNTLILRGLSPTSGEASIQAALAQFFPSAMPALQSVRVITERGSRDGLGYCFVRFATQHQAQAVHATAIALEGAGGGFDVDGRRVLISFAGPLRNPDRPLSQQHQEEDAAATAASVAAAATPWTCGRCGADNGGERESCELCNIARVVLEGGDAATAAMSTSLRSAGAAQAAVTAYPPHAVALRSSPYAIAPVTTEAVPAVTITAPPLPPPVDESLVASIKAGTVLLLSNVPADASASVVRDALVPFCAVLDVALLFDAQSGLSLRKAFVTLDDAAETQRVLAMCTSVTVGGVTYQPRTRIRIADESLSIEWATDSATHIALVRQSRLVTWLAESSEHARERLSTAVKAVAAQQVNIGKGTHTLWNERVSEQAALYAPALAAGAAVASAAALPPRPTGLASTFHFDASSGQWLDPSSGYYFDPHSQLFFHAASGFFSRWDATHQKYVAIDPATAGVAARTGFAFPQQQSDTAAEVATQYRALKAAQALFAATTVEGHSGLTSAKSSSVIDLSSENDRPPPSTQGGPTAVPPPPPPAVADGATIPPSFLDLPRLACLLCSRQLSTLEQLLKHEQLSGLHRNNLALWHANNPGVAPPTSAGALRTSAAGASAKGDTGAASAPAAATPSSSASHPVAAALAVAVAPVRSPPAAPPTAAAAAVVPRLSAAEEYKRQMASFRTLDREDTKHSLLK